MLTYQLQRRNFKLADGAEWKFPNDAEIEFEFEPQEPFGARHGFSRTALKSAKATVLYNANNGRSFIRSEKLMDAVGVVVHYEDVKYAFRGNKLHAQCHCATQDALVEFIYRIQGLLPPILCVFLYDPPFITTVGGKVGKTAFRWELAETLFAFQGASKEKQEGNLEEALSLLGGNLGPSPYRIHAALSYFYRACRLLAAGNGPWEFMPEAILNLTKSLEILFNNPSIANDQQDEKGSRERIRQGLKSVGIDHRLIESVFVRIAILRNEFDVGHGRLALNDMGDLQLIYNFLASAENEFRKLFHHIVTGLAAKTLELPSYVPDTEVSYSKGMQGVIDALRSTKMSA